MTPPPDLSLRRLFVSAVTDEFGSYRWPLKSAIERPGVQVEIQETFLAYGDRTLLMLDEYVASCSAVIHLTGERTGNAASGGIASEVNVAALINRYPDLMTSLQVTDAFLRTLSYTQWEAWLAVYHGRKLFIAPAKQEARRDTVLADQEVADAQRLAQLAHLAALRKAGHYPHDQLAFESCEKLTIKVLRTLHNILAPVDPLAVRIIIEEPKHVLRHAMALLGIDCREKADWHIMQTLFESGHEHFGQNMAVLTK
jgi:hypothetical protein